MLRSLARKVEVCVLSFDSKSTEEDFAGEAFRVISRPAPPWRAPQLIRHWQAFVRAEVSRVVAQRPRPDALIATTSTLAAFDACPPEVARIALVRAFENFGLRCPWVSFRQRINLGKLAAVRRFEDPRLMRKADGVFTNSLFMRSAIASRFGVKADRIHALTQSLNVAPSETCAPPNTIGFVTRGRDKGVSVILEIARRSPDLTYLVYGHDGDLPSELPANVRWQGWASDRSAMFASAKLWLVPSLWAEPFGRVSIEAQAADRAVLVADHGGLPETVFDSRFRIEGFNPTYWLSRMRDLLALSCEDIRANGARTRAAFSDDVHDVRLRETLGAAMELHGRNKDV